MLRPLRCLTERVVAASSLILPGTRAAGDSRIRTEGIRMGRGTFPYMLNGSLRSGNLMDRDVRRH